MVRKMLTKYKMIKNKRIKNYTPKVTLAHRLMATIFMIAPFLIVTN